MNGFLEALLFDPVISFSLIGIIAGLLFLILIRDFIQTKNKQRFFLRTLVLFCFVLFFLNPVVIKNQTTTLDDIVLVLVDESPSNQINERSTNTINLKNDLLKKLQALQENHPHTVQVVSISNDQANQTDLLPDLKTALSNLPVQRLAGVFFISDGQIHDTESVSALLPQWINKGPFHLLLTDKTNQKDRRLVINKAPSYGLVGETVNMTLSIEDNPSLLQPDATIRILSHKTVLHETIIPVGEPVTFSLPIHHAGTVLFEIETDVLPDEFTSLNNKTVLEIQGIRNRLKVLLVSGLPYNGERVWRNLLKSDPNIDLVHFTILRSANSIDNTPTEELALIPFPTRELFVEKINEFDLIIFDRFARLGLIPIEYVNNIATYIQQGGAFLDILSPHEQFGGLFQTQLDAILPAQTTGQKIEQAFTPSLSDLGKRHPVTKNLNAFSNPWGEWYHQVGLRTQTGQVLMNGSGSFPLLVLGEVGQGRTAQLASDQIWLWAKNYQGGGPYHQILRRLSHWLMKEPDLNENRLTATSSGRTIEVDIQTTQTGEQVLTLIAPDGLEQTISFTPDENGNANIDHKAKQYGVYAVSLEGLAQTSVIVGGIHEKEFQNILASKESLSPLVKKTKGSILPIDQKNSFRLHSLSNASSYGGRNWLGLQKRQFKDITNSQTSNLITPWVGLILLSGLLILGWLIEGRKKSIKE